MLIFLQLLLIPLEILNHEVFANQLVMVGEMVHNLGLIEPDARFGVEQVSGGPDGGPVEVPVVIVFVFFDPPSCLKVLYHDLFVEIWLPL